MDIDVIAEIVATSFNADRPALRRYSATVILRAPDKTATRRMTGYGEDADSACITAVRKALQSWGCVTIAPEEVRVAAGNLPDGYGRAYLDEAYMCAECANRLPAGSQARRDILAVAAAYERQYIAVRYEYLRNY